MNYTIFSPNEPKLLDTLKANLAKNEYPRAIQFLSELYIRHRQFDDEETIDRNEHKPKSIHSKKVRQILGRYYRATIDTLVLLGFVEFYPSYCAKRFSKGYRLTQRVLAVPFVKSGEVNRIQVIRDRDRELQELPPVYQRILADASLLGFDYEAARKFIESDDSLKPAAKSWYLNFAELAAKDDLSASICEQGRFHYKLTFCPRKLRPFFTLKGAKLVQIDIKACQVMLHTSLYPAPCDEKAYFDHVCSTGQFWQLLNSMLKVPHDLADPDEKVAFKKKCFRQLFFTSRDFLYVGSQIVKGFKAHFPQLYDLMMEAKRKCRKEGREMACEMQKLEVKIVIHNTVSKQQTAHPENSFLTIHDCIECEDFMVDIVKKALTEAVVEEIGVVPGLDVKAMDAPMTPKALESTPISPDEIGIPSILAKDDEKLIFADDVHARYLDRDDVLTDEDLF